jgi:hypothetical protein
MPCSRRMRFSRPAYVYVLAIVLGKVFTQLAGLEALALLLAQVEGRPGWGEGEGEGWGSTGRRSSLRRKTE